MIADVKISIQRELGKRPTIELVKYLPYCN